MASSVNISSIMRNLSSFLQDHKVSFTNGMLVLFTLGGEQIFRFSAFKCPSTQPEAKIYALIFIICPAIVLAIMGVVINNVTWRICHGCCHRLKSTKYGCWNSTSNFFSVLARAFIVPCAWVFLTFLDGDYYYCMKAKSPGERESEEKRHLVSQSQIISWIGLVTVLGVVILVMFIARCFDSMTYFENRSVIIYREAEEIRLEEILKRQADELAKENVKEFVDSKLQKEDWDLISKVPESTVKITQPIKEINFTELQKWLQQKKTINGEEETPKPTDEHEFMPLDEHQV